MDSLLREAQDQGIRVIIGTPPYDWWGAYSHRLGTIIIRDTLGPVSKRSTLAHELGHAHHGHTGHHPFTERHAKEWAARRLITVDALWDAWCESTDVRRIAPMLGVLIRDVETRLTLLTPDEATRFQRHLHEVTA